MQSGQSSNFSDGDATEHKPHISELMEFEKTIWSNHGESLSNMPWWSQVQAEEASLDHNYVDYLAETSAFAPTVTPDMMLDSLPLPAFPNSYDAYGLSDYQLDLGLDFGSTLNQLLARKHHEDLGSQFSARELQAQNCVSWMESLNGENSGFNTQVGTERASVGAPAGSSTKQRSRATSSESKLTDRQQRRNQINEKLAAVQELLPTSTQGSQASVLDDFIDHIKQLQLEMKDVCDSKVRSENESTKVPLIYREGYGHYFSDQEELGEPLEEMIGKLMESNPEEAMNLLQMKGLLLMPIHYAQRLA